MDQWKREAIRMLQETEFGKTTVRFDKYKNPYTTNRCFECNGLGYHKTGCKLFKILSAPPELNLLLIKLYDTFKSKCFTLEQAEKKLKIPADELREQMNDLVTYDSMEGLIVKKREVYAVTKPLIDSEEFIKGVEELHGTN